MDCKNCELRQRQFFCTSCIRAHTRDFRVKTAHFAAERDEQVAKSTKALGVVEAARVRRASVAQIQSRVDDLLGALVKLRKDNDKKRDRLRNLRESLAERRRTFAAASAIANPSPTTVPLAGPLNALANLSSLIARARSGLVQELVEVFNIVEVGGRPPLGGKAGSQGEWTIGDLILPVPGDVRRYPPQHINAVLGHTIHFVGLLSFYLGVKLPFNVQWEGGKLGVGVPWIGPGLGGWGRWTSSHPLHLSLSPAPTPAAPSHLRISSSPADLSLSQSISQSIAESITGFAPFTSPSPTAVPSPATMAKTTPSSPHSTSPPDADTPQFTTALAMLLFNVLYLAHTQGLAVPLAQAGDALSNLWAVCCAPELGRRAHATAGFVSSMTPGTSGRLPAPSPSTVPVDFAHVLQAAASGGGRRSAVARHVSTGTFVEAGAGTSAEGAGRNDLKSKSRGRWKDADTEQDGKKKKEVEDGWDLVSGGEDEY